MKNIASPLLVILFFFATPFCPGMSAEENSHDLRKRVLYKATYQKLDAKVKSIISNGYRTIDTLTEFESYLLIKHMNEIQARSIEISYTEQVFFNRLVEQQLEKDRTHEENQIDKTGQLPLLPSPEDSSDTPEDPFASLYRLMIASNNTMPIKNKLTPLPLPEEVSDSSYITPLQYAPKMRDKIKTIIANCYTGMEDLTEKEQAYLLKEYELRGGKTQDLFPTEQVFFERFIAWASLKNISETGVSKTKNPNSVLIDQILTKIQPAPDINYQNNSAPSIPHVDELNYNNPTLAIRKKNTSEPFSRNFSETLSTILPTEEIPLIFDDDEESGDFVPERLS